MGQQMSNRFRPEDLQEIKTKFDSIDQNKDGELSKDEIMKLDGQVEGFYFIFMMCKRNDRGNIEYNTFLKALDDLKTAFFLSKSLHRMDDNLFNDYSHDGFLTVDDFKEINKRLKFRDFSPEELFKILDKNGKGKIDRNEFSVAFEVETNNGRINYLQQDGKLKK